MNENNRTMVFVGVAVVVAVLAWVSQRGPGFDKPDEVVGQLLFPEFSPLDATSLEVVRYDEQTSTVQPFKVEQVGTGWKIPSHSNYPADAKDQLVDAATNLMNRKILAMVSDDAGDHAQYGVLDPTDKALKPGTTGVGTRVVLNADARYVRAKASLNRDFVDLTDGIDLSGVQVSLGLHVRI